MTKSKLQMKWQELGKSSFWDSQPSMTMIYNYIALIIPSEWLSQKELFPTTAHMIITTKY